ncbi:hypothetical protein M405DRAFT_28656 [Rhizopogon salebrosus TDB-379]|nr:hypothetical protein M405DRAFT_28656 [Rhizopogon salebrosus TDB-379]
MKTVSTSYLFQMSQLEGHKLTPILWRPPAQLKDTRRLPQGEDAAKDAGFEDLLFIPDKVAAVKLFVNTDATRQSPAQLEGAHRLPPGFCNDAWDDVHPSTVPSTYSRFSAHRRRAPACSPTSCPHSFLGCFPRLSIVHNSTPMSQ